MTRSGIASSDMFYFPKTPTDNETMNNPKEYALLPKKKYLLIPPELSDGENQLVVEMKNIYMIKDGLEVWLDELAEVGDTLEIKCIELSDEEVSKLGDM